MWKILADGKTLLDGKDAPSSTYLSERNGASGWSITRQDGWAVGPSSTSDHLVWRKAGDPYDGLIWRRVSDSFAFECTVKLYVAFILIDSLCAHKICHHF